ncbi:MAG: ABC transporter permease [Rhizobiales bacterium]|nr:ABC transporter permease [Hyphomicrobiales bacterium]
MNTMSPKYFWVERLMAFRPRLWISTHGALLPLGLALLLLTAMFTPGFLSAPNLLSLVNTASVIGCVAVAMMLITISGNVLSFALGVTTGCSAMMFAWLTGYESGLLATVGALVFSTVVTGFQGLLIGLFRANPIIVSIAALGLMTGAAELISQGSMIYASGSQLQGLNDTFWSVPASGWVLLALVLLADFILRFTRFGRNIVMLGSNMTAAKAAGISLWRTTVGVYALAGLFSGIAGILLAARYNAGSLEYGIGYDYSAIAAVLVGGTFIGGGEGTALRTLAGLVVITGAGAILLLHGVSTEYQFLFTGLVLLVAVLVQGR